eukprot:scaffold10357_cov66-Attheya_sp.AAC.6
MVTRPFGLLVEARLPEHPVPVTYRYVTFYWRYLFLTAHVRALALLLLKAAVNRTNGKGNAEMDKKVINFYRFVATYSPKSAMIVSANLHWKLNAQDRSSCILDDDHNIVVSRMKNAIADRAIDDKTPVSSTYKAIIGGAHPNHKVDVTGLLNDDINVILDGTSKSIKLEEANEVKVAIVSFQSTKPGVSPSVIVAAHPQSNNETSDFVQAIWSMQHQWRQRTGLIDHVGSTDTNHNMKSWRNQIIGGSCAVTIGTCVIDTDLLRLSGISADLWRPIDFASDLLVLKLALHGTVQSLYDYHSISEDETDTVTDFSAGDIGSLMVTFVTTKLRLYSINSRDVVDAKQ